ncbi:type I-G CRISPR-associated helicase/endonuclease Cas3g [Haliangium ochraceum]|uniref:CRISPR-associated helicase Cas3, Anaes-subtype n=1 Tax=Haliangium ochraceum (strain DSM 14365 / JCM 11303 / SMP-2) TaxID=502025 RepID=D0LSW7_HALO1|nr:type I-U CRISPR-associated helicase/endonuclease Cas3 [Haliangium ochraceum]ACY17339.1 CRISPR-associated helicase Cas3, Anaes-subtype [Haliangium ochraceum DSM 14365]
MSNRIDLDAHPLAAERFDEFFAAVYGYEPFPWQRRLAHQVADGAWPDALALPTAAGKTACIDIAVFALACQAGRAADKRSAARRIFFVVDRRVIVDEAHRRARALRDKLHQATSGVLFHVAQRLRYLADARSAEADADTSTGTGEPEDIAALTCFQLRGGMYRDDSWVDSPCQPAVIASTVDQIGSRLLFRGYGLRKGLLNAIHAGMVANDALILLDEAHCARPFMQTCAAVRDYRRHAEQPVGGPFEFAIMSATPPAELRGRDPGRSVDNFELNAEDRENDVLAQRLQATKPSALVTAKKARGSRAQEHLADELVSQALALAKDSEIGRVGVIVNRVAVARLVHAKLRQRVGARAVLLIGRMRPVDRDDLMASWQPGDHSDASDAERPRGLYAWFGAGEDRIDGEAPVFAVATQCLEVGANLDFDALVTECASLDALRQRFGRLDRLGNATGARGVIVIRADQVQPKDDDPIYGAALPATWAWLSEHAKDERIDMGIAALDALMKETPKEQRAALSTPTLDAPTMLPAHIDLWSQTHPMPRPDPDVAVFLHGPQRGPADVQVCWRADLDPPSEGMDDKQLAAVWTETVAQCPPSSLECMPVPLKVARQWLQSSGLKDADRAIEDDGGDLESARADEGFLSPPDGDSQRRALRWLGPQDSGVVGPADAASLVRPGDTLVIPEQLGGWEVFGHIPDTSLLHPQPPVPGRRPGVDQGERVHLASRNRAVLRLHPRLLERWPQSQARDALLALATSDDLAEQLAEPDFQSTLSTQLADLAKHSASEALAWRWLPEAARALRTARARTMQHSAGLGLALRGKQRVSRPNDASGAPTARRSEPRVDPHLDHDGHLDFTDEDHSSSATVPVRLSRHNADVQRWARAFAESVGLSEVLVHDIALAGSVHDLGKADIRFQATLFGGDLLAARMQLEPLAKSAEHRVSGGYQAYRRVLARCGYPEGARHELVSVRLVEASPELLGRASDAELVLHLVASHHGRCRPFAPVVVDPEPVSVRVEHGDLVLETSSATGLERIDSGVAERFWTLQRRYGWWGLAWLEACLRLGDWSASREEREEREEREQSESHANKADAEQSHEEDAA